MMPPHGKMATCCLDTLRTRAPKDPHEGQIIYCRFSVCLDELRFINGRWEAKAYAERYLPKWVKA